MPFGWGIEMAEEGSVAGIVASWVGDGLKESALKAVGCGGMTYPKGVLLSEGIDDDCPADGGESKDGPVPKNGLVVLDLAGSVADSGEPAAMGMSPSLS